MDYAYLRTPVPRKYLAQGNGSGEGDSHGTKNEIKVDSMSQGLLLCRQCDIWESFDPHKYTLVRLLCNILSLTSKFVLFAH